MSRSQNRSVYQNIEMPLMKINELINSIFAMNQSTIIEHLHTCSKIVGQLLQNQLINHFSSIQSAKLLCYQLILMIAQDNAVDTRPKLTTMENIFGNNKKIKLTSSMRNTLASINQILQQVVWKNTNINPRKGGTQKNIGDSAMYQNYVQFKHLLNDFDRQLKETQNQKIITPQIYNNSSQKQNNNKINKQTQQNEQQSQDENQALIQQLQQIVAKKQKRIKQLNDQLQQNILQQKAQQDLISQLQSRNMDMRDQIKLLNQKITYCDTNQIKLQQQIDKLKAKINIQDRQLLSVKDKQKQKQRERERENTIKKGSIKTQKTIKTLFTMDQLQQPLIMPNINSNSNSNNNINSNSNNNINSISNKKQYKQILNQKQIQICPQCQSKQDISIQDINSFRRMLLTQCISIQALIIQQ